MRKGERKQFCKSGHDTLVCGRDSSRRCKECRRTQARRWFADNREKVRDRNRRSYAVNREKYRSRHRENSKKYHIVHPTYRHDYYVANKGKRSRYSVTYRMANREKLRQQAAVRALFGSTSTKTVPQELLEIGVLYYKAKKEIANGQTTQH